MVDLESQVENHQGDEDREDRALESSIVEGTDRRSSLRSAPRKTRKTRSHGFAERGGCSKQEETITIITCERQV